VKAAPTGAAGQTATLDTPIGTLTLVASGVGLTRVTLRPVRPEAARPDPAWASPPARRWLDLGRRELDGYFAGQRRAFTVPVDLHRVAALHRRILDGLAGVGYGETTTYGRLAREVGLGLTDAGPRQVGGAMARNPVMIIVPCHRVLGADGGLVGYAGGLAVKQWLLDLESRDRTPQLGLSW
jgi:methylated-DNA-[protein]-cysteine S-methyltransferase